MMNTLDQLENTNNGTFYLCLPPQLPRTHFPPQGSGRVAGLLIGDGTSRLRRPPLTATDPMEAVSQTAYRYMCNYDKAVWCHPVPIP